MAFGVMKERGTEKEGIKQSQAHWSLLQTSIYDDTSILNTLRVVYIIWTDFTINQRVQFHL